MWSFFVLTPWLFHCLFQRAVGGCASALRCTEGPSCTAENQPEEHDSVSLLQVSLEVREQIPEGDTKAVTGHPTWGFVHIPKAGGASFSMELLDPDGPRLLPEGDGMAEGEMCHSEMEWKLKQKGVAAAAQHYATMFREPRAHVYSQYLECVDSDWGRMMLNANAMNRAPVLLAPANKIFRNVTTWLTHFAADMSTTFDGGCYSPVNMQSRVFECSTRLHQNSNRPLPIDVLRQSMERYTFVGIVERYQESVCLFAFLASGSLPAYCDCKDNALWKTFPAFHITEGVRKHNVNDLSDHDLKMVDALTEKDVMLWQGAVQRFTSDIDKAEQETGKKILCDRQIVPDYMTGNSKSPS